VEARRVHQPFGRQNVDNAAPIWSGAQKVVDVERRLSEELLRALALQHQQTALNHADRRRCDIAVLAAQSGRLLAHLVDDAAQVLKIEQVHLSGAALELILSPPEAKAT